MPRSVRALYDAIETIPPPGADGRLEALDHLAARAVTALARFADQPQALIPAQRALLLLGGRPGPTDDAVYGLVAALRDIDSNLGEMGGFSRLLESALEAGEVRSTDRLRPTTLELELQDLASELEQLAHTLGVLDDLSHATNTPSALAAGALVTCFVMQRVAAQAGLDEEARIAEAQAWVAHRGASRSLRALLPFEAALHHLDDECVVDAERADVARAFAMWVLASRMAGGAQDLASDDDDRAAMEALLKKAGLWPLAVFDRGF